MPLPNTNNTVQDIYDLPEEPAELIDGTMYMMAPQAGLVEIVGEIFAVIRDYITERRSMHNLCRPFEVFLNER